MPGLDVKGAAGRRVADFLQVGQSEKLNVVDSKAAVRDR
jgi:hypothetical protein